MSTSTNEDGVGLVTVPAAWVEYACDLAESDQPRPHGAIANLRAVLAAAQKESA